MKRIAKLSANFTLIDTEEACEQIQRGNFNLESIATTTEMENDKTTSKNKAVFLGVHSDKVLNELTFVVVGDQKPASITEKMTGDGQTAICDSEIFVKNTVTRVLVFGRRV